MPVEAKSLQKALIPSDILSNPSPGSLQSTRLALHVNEDGSSCSVYIASGCHVYNIEVSLEDSIINKGKESLLIPVNAHVTSSSIVDRCPHRSEIQGLELSKGDGDNSLIMGTVDSFGHLIVSKMGLSGADIDRISYSVPPHDFVGEGSWAGICFSPLHWSMAAVARSFSKCIDIYDQDIHLRSLRSLWYPASQSFLQGPQYNEGTVLVVAEGSQLSMWDLRTTHNGGCVQRICGSIGDTIYSVCCSPSGVVAAGGSDRTVTVYDPRRWSAVARWVGCSKYEVTSLALSSIDPDYIYIQGVDYEVICGTWKENRKALSFRGDSNWLGFGKCADKDVLAGWSDSGSIFIVDVAEKQ